MYLNYKSSNNGCLKVVRVRDSFGCKRGIEVEEKEKVVFNLSQKTIDRDASMRVPTKPPTPSAESAGASSKFKTALSCMIRVVEYIGGGIARCLQRKERCDV